MALKPCRECGASVSTSAESCPHCGVRNPASADVLASINAPPKDKKPNGCAIVIGVIVLLIIVGSIVGNSEDKSSEHAACRGDWRQCVDNSELVNNYKGWSGVQVDCKIAAEKSARYGTPTFPWLSFGTFLKGKDYVQTGKVVAIEPEAQFQNGFGAMVHSRVVCQYDLNQSKVIDVSIAPN